jgi:hypothetical protein
MARGEIDKNGMRSASKAVQGEQDTGQEAAHSRMLDRRGASSKRSLEDPDMVPPPKRTRRAGEVHPPRTPKDGQQGRQEASSQHFPVTHRAGADQAPVERAPRPRTSRRETALLTQQSGQRRQAQHLEAMTSPDIMQVARSWRRRMSGYYGLPTDS